MCRNGFIILFACIASLVFFCGSAFADNPGGKSGTANSNEGKDRDVFNESVIKTIQAYRQKQYKVALVYCEEAMAWSMASKERNPEAEFSIRMMCVQLYNENDRHEEALRLLGDIRRLELTEKMKDIVCTNEATTLTQLHRWDEARQKYGECPGVDTKGRAVAAGNLAELSMIQGMPGEAVSGYEASIAQFPENPHARFGLAVALSRMERWDDAAARFMEGMMIDPGFGYLREAFFEPAYDGDYETAVRMIMLHRDREAVFYLERYLKNETRQNYRDVASHVLDRLNADITDGKSPLVASFAVPFERVGIAVDSTGTKLAIKDVVARPDHGGVDSVIWTVDLNSGKTVEHLHLGTELVLDMAFVGETSRIRLLSVTSRYEFDMDNPGQGYLKYPNYRDEQGMTFPIGMTTKEKDIMMLNASGSLSIAPWLDPWKQISMLPVPSEIKWIYLSYDHNTVFMGSYLKASFWDVASASKKGELPSAIDVSAVSANPARNMFAMGVQSGTMLFEVQPEDIRPIAVMGSASLSAVTKLSFSPNGKFLATVSDDNLVEVWDVDRLLAK